MKQRTLFVALILLLCSGTGALALNALTDDQLTRISGTAGITIAVNDMLLRMEATNATLNLNPDRPITTTGHFLNIEDDPTTGAAAPYPSTDADPIAITIGSNTVEGTALHEWAPAVIDMKLNLDVATDATRTYANLALYNWDGNLYLKADRLELNDSAHTNNFVFGLNVGDIDFAANGANPSMYMTIAAHDTSTNKKGISGELGMKLLVGEVGFTGINRTTPANPATGIAHGIGLLFCQNFSDNATATAFGANWSTTYWLANTASGMWTMGNLDEKPLTMDVVTYGTDYYMLLTIQGHFTKRFNYYDIGSTNMGTTTVWAWDGNGDGDTLDAGEIHISDPTTAANDAYNTRKHVLGEVRLDYIEGRVDGVTRNIGGLSLEDLSMERTLMVLTPDGNPYTGHPFHTNALNPGGNETELPTAAGVLGTGGIDTTLTNWNNTF